MDHLTPLKHLEITMICGYAGTGKDTLLRMLTRPRGSTGHSWIVYAAPWMQPRELDKCIFNCSKGSLVKRYAFADAIKNEFRIRNDLHPSFDIDSNKELLFGDRTIRQHLIDIATAKREIDPNYWANIISFKIHDDRRNFDDRRALYPVLTDFRFPNEIEKIQGIQDSTVTTVRVFRKDVKVAPKSVLSEHSLDHLITDFLLVPTLDDYLEALKLFPRYADHKMIASLY